MNIKITECEGTDAGRGLPRDYGFVHADMFEAELFISLINVEE